MEFEKIEYVAAVGQEKALRLAERLCERLWEQLEPLLKRPKVRV